METTTKSANQATISWLYAQLITLACKKNSKENFFNIQLAFLLLNTSMKAIFSHHVKVFQNKYDKGLEINKIGCF